ncbi:hypothetical protein CEXT_422591 [Caerostris extrusa]|uniref:Uncharacterized protein n=1 Tax=Caerostris extrusa TaxID=172846 RepID=A0AAV4MW01_CAEEX|nr:hypothetical protein CEXT_422591 [Caerostris extrusa]
MRPGRELLLRKGGRSKLFRLLLAVFYRLCWMVDWSGRTTLRTFIRRLAPAHMLTCSALALLPLPHLPLHYLLAFKKFCKRNRVIGN